MASSGATGQTQCAAGSFSDTTGATICTQADAGSFVAGSGAIGQTACPAGTSSPAPGATSESDCLPIAGNDADLDGVPDSSDNAPNVYNPDQSDIDADGFGDVIDPCPSDPTDTCDPNGSAAASIGPGGGNLSTPDGNVQITVPPGSLDADTTISITDIGTGFELTTNLGQSIGVFGINIEPAGTVFLIPITLVFAWDDADNDGKVDGTNIKESKLLISKDNVALTGKCPDEPGCDQVANTFTFTVSSLSEFVLAGPGLISLVDGLDLPAGTENALISKLEAAIKALEKGKDKTAVNQINAFINYVQAQSGKKIDAADADDLIAAAEAITAAIQGGS